MSATASVARESSLRQVRNAVREFRIIPRIETFPAVVRFAQSVPGKLVLLTVFGFGQRFFLPDTSSVLGLMVPFTLMTVMPEYRRLLLAVTPVVYLIAQSLHEPLRLGTTVAVIATGMVLYMCVMRWPDSLFGRRPVAFLLTGYSALIAVSCVAPPHSLAYSILWSAVGAMTAYVWFIAYALTDRTSKPARDWTLELGTFRPLWGSTTTPFPKGAAYLRRIEAQTPEQLAVTQLKGLKLLAWAIVLAGLSRLWHQFFHGYLAIPTSAGALQMSVQGTPAAWHLRWESLILAFFESILAISIMGHRIIALCRLAGYNALRNTCRPLSSTTIAEFFNRFYYYFKELLVDLFFYPAFLRYWKRHRRIRTAFATFSAALFGNTFFHFTRDWEIIRDTGVRHALASYEASFVYCLLLATGLTISQLRTRRPKSTGWFRGMILPAIGVGAFYCLINVFVIGERNYPLVVYLRYFGSLFLIHV
jgi:hypothetical protein